MAIGKVYVVHNDWIKDPETGDMPYKIGVTKDTVDNRYYGLGLKMPGEFICDFAYEFTENYEKIEKALHDMFNKLNINGEWFNINEDALDGIKSICELLGGKLITERVEEEIEKGTGVKKNPAFDKIVERWNEVSEMKATGQSHERKHISIPGLNKGVHYQFRIRNPQELNIDLSCWTKIYPTMDNLLKGFDELNINNYVFNYISPNYWYKKMGWSGKIRTIIPLTAIDEIIEVMKSLIEITKDKIIEECNKD